MKRKRKMMSTILTKHLKHSDTEPLNHGDGNESVNDR